MQSIPLSPSLPTAVHLQATDPARNIARRYAIEASLDLFGHWIIQVSWGRIGTRGQNSTVSFEKYHDARSFVRRTLGRRASAKKRIGVAYRIATSNDS